MLLPQKELKRQLNSYGFQILISSWRVGVCFSKLQYVGNFSSFPSKSIIPHKQYRITYVVFLFFVFFSYYIRTISLRGPAIDLQDERGA